MPHTDESSPKHKLLIKFCDDSSSERTYEATTFGGLVAREEYQEMVEKGNENDTVWAVIPHITQVDLRIADSDTHVFEVFECACTKAKGKVSA